MAKSAVVVAFHDADPVNLRLIDPLLEKIGGSRPASEGQLEYIMRLVGEIGMTESDDAALVGARGREASGS